MDESLSDFKVPKKIVRPAKKQAKTTRAKLKKCKGQKDILKALEADKKSDIVTYTNDFGKACTSLGIDVDPGHLQLAVALSTSLAEYEGKDLKTQNSVCNFKTTDEIPCLSPSSKVSKIRSTLQEYGFKLKRNHISIPFNSRKWKAKRYIKYDLLYKTKEDKAQMVADKFSQILIDGLINTQCDREDVKCNCNIAACLERFYRFDASVYNKSNYTFAECENDKLYFYTNNLIEISNDKIGCFLRNWSAIPGRPPSPVRSRTIPSFDTHHIMQGQDNIDKILSGTEDICRNFIQSFLDKDTDDMEVIKIGEVGHNTESLEETRDVYIRSTSPDIFDESLEVITTQECESDDELPKIELGLSEKKRARKNFQETTQTSSNYQVGVQPDNVSSYSLHSFKCDQTATYAMIKFGKEEKATNFPQTSEKMEISLCPSNSENIDFVDFSSNQLDVIDVKADNISASENKFDESSVESKSVILKKSMDQSIDLTQDSVYGTQFNPTKFNSQSSEYSEIFEISDEEVNYSMNRRHSSENNTKILKHDINSDEDDTYRRSEKFYLYGSSLFDQIPTSFTTVQKSIGNSLNTEDGYCPDRDSYLPEVAVGYRQNESTTDIQIQQIVTPQTTKVTNRISTTPSNSEYMIKTKNVTPLMDYKSLTTPDRNKELSKYGLKPFKRKRAIQLLEHLYYQTHPLMEECDKLPQDIMKSQSSPGKSDQRTVENISPVLVTHKTEDKMFESNESLEIAQKITEMDIYEVTNNTPVIKNIESDAFEWVFQKKEKPKIQGCRVPLHIAFHNYVSARRRLKEAILRYEPIRIDVIHNQLVNEGLRYASKDLLKFMDRKCITVKTLDKSVC